MSIIAGLAVWHSNLEIIVVLQVLTMLAVPLALRRIPPVVKAQSADTISAQSVRTLILLPAFRRVVLVAALILGSHALHDTFSMLRWTNAGISTATASVLWSLAVGAEVLVFFLVGPG